jgi:hypothetical protein
MFVDSILLHDIAEDEKPYREEDQQQTTSSSWLNFIKKSWYVKARPLLRPLLRFLFLFFFTRLWMPM